MKLRNRRFVANVDQLEGRQLLSTMFSVKDLGLSSRVMGINTSGQIVGSSISRYETSDISVSGPNGSSPMTSVDDGPGEARCINDSGCISGGYQFDEGQEAFLYKPGVGLEDIGNLGGGWSLANAINNNSVVTGSSLTNSGQNHAFVYDSKMTDIGTLGGPGSVAYGINDSSQVVGTSSTAKGEYHAFFYSNGTMNDLGSLGGGYSCAFSINGSGQVVGFSNLTSPGPVHAFLSDPNGGPLHDLGLLTGSTADTALAVNDQGQVVGSATMADGSEHGFYYDGHSMMDLNSLLPANSGFTIQYARGINNSDQIAAYGVDASGQGHALLLTLIPPPTMTLSGGYLTIASQVASGDNVVVAIDPANGNVQVTADGVIEEFAGVNSIHYLSSTGGGDTFENHTNLTCIVSAYGSNNTFVGANGTTWYGFLVSDDNTIQDDGGVSIINGFNDTDHFSGTGTLIIL